MTESSSGWSQHTHTHNTHTHNTHTRTHTTHTHTHTHPGACDDDGVVRRRVALVHEAVEAEDGVVAQRVAILIWKGKKPESVSQWVSRLPWLETDCFA